MLPELKLDNISLYTTLTNLPNINIQGGTSEIREQGLIGDSVEFSIEAPDISVHGDYGYTQKGYKYTLNYCLLGQYEFCIASVLESVDSFIADSKDCRFEVNFKEGKVFKVEVKDLKTSETIVVASKDDNSPLLTL